MAGTLLLSGPCWQCPALLTWALNIELEPVELIGDSVLSCALILVGVSCVATLFLAVPEEPAGAEAVWARGGTGLWHWVWAGTVCQQQERTGAHCLWQRARTSSPVPVRVLAEHGWITHHDQQSLGPGDGHVKPLKRTSKRVLPGCNTSHCLAAPPGCRQLWCSS